MQNKMKKSKLTQHSLQRAKERIDTGSQLPNRKLREIMLYGFSPGDFKDDFYSYLIYTKSKKHSSSIGIRVLYDLILLYNKRSRRVITVYPVPEKFLPVDQYLHVSTKSIYNKLLIEVSKLHKGVKSDIELKVLTTNPKEVVVGLTIDNIFRNFGKGSSTDEAKINALELYLNTFKKEDLWEILILF